MSSVIAHSTIASRSTSTSYSVYLDYSLTRIGIGNRVSELLESAHAVTTVRDLLQLTTSKILSTPQISQQSLCQIMQCLCNVGFPVRNYQREHDFVLAHDPADDQLLASSDAPDCALLKLVPSSIPAVLSHDQLITI